MPAVTTADLNNAKLDVDHIAAIATSPAPTATDRLGQEKQTLSGLLADLNAEAAVTATGVNRDAAATSAAEAAAHEAGALTGSAAAGVYPNSASANVPRGLTQASVGAITPGAGGTNGTFALAWTGGNFAINPTGTFTVAGGVLTAVTITGPGLYIGAAPAVPAPSFAASAGLAGAAVALTAQFLVAAGQGYWVQSTDGRQLLRYKNVGGVATSDTANVSGLPTFGYVDDSYHERLFSAQGRWLEQLRTRNLNTQRPRALVLIALGQSNNANYNAPLTVGQVSSNAYQPAGGNAIGFWDFYASNQAHAVHWDDIGLAPVPWADATTENALTGAITVLDGVFPRIYAFSAAYGGAAILMIGGAGRRTNLYAAVHKLCDHARAAGFEPVVAATALQGEANMASFGLMDETSYYTAAMGYYRMFQMLAAQAMEQPGYEAPIVFHTPVQMSNGEASRGIVTAIVRVANDIPNGILAGGMYPWPVNGDLIHGTAVGFRQRSEYDGWLLSRFFTRGDVHKGLKMVDAVSTGPTTKVVTFNDEIERDLTVNFGAALNVTAQLGGLEYDDAGVDIPITNIAAAGRKATLTLASAPVGAANAQYVRNATQTAPAGGAWPQMAAGSQIRSATETGFLSLYDPTFRQYVWSAPQKIAVR
jgi:hypothetical protein